MNYIDVKNFRKYEKLFGDNGPAKIGHVNAVIKALNEATSGGGSAYKVYTALLTQNGGDDIQSTDTGLITIGVTYRIANPSPGMDFTNVGAPNNNIGTYFVAIGTTPASWGSNENTGNSTLEWNNGAPVVTVLENTIGNIYWTFATNGIYTGYLPDTLLTEGKQITLSIPYSRSTNNGTSAYYMAIENNDVDGEVGINTSDGTAFANIGFNNFPIEIRVYY